MQEYQDLNPKEDEIDKTAEARIWDEISAIDGASEYFREMLSLDMKRHFLCPKEQQDIVRGAFYRTEYFSKMLKKNSSVDN